LGYADRTQGIDASDPNYATFKKACRLKAFDVARGWLPAGVTTNLSWTTSLATLNRELLRLYAHPLQEVRDLAAAVHAQVKVAYPSIWRSFTGEQDQELIAQYRGEGYNISPHDRDDTSQDELRVVWLRDVGSKSKDNIFSS
jgi:thymidylate synthase ThyX